MFGLVGDFASSPAGVIRSSRELAAAGAGVTSLTGTAVFAFNFLDGVAAAGLGKPAAFFSARARLFAAFCAFLSAGVDRLIPSEY
jgi:hypothetical protein